jgi:predicted AAA+ superfamily ATPase
MTDSEQQGFLRPDGYRPRLVDSRLDTLLRAFGGVEITGAKWCGKTWTALAHARSVDRLDEEATFRAAQLDPSLVLTGDTPHLVDEWQEVVGIWDAARRHIDANAHAKGQLLLTGSSIPKGDGIRHSGTGRIARLRMRPMALFETGDSTGDISLASLFSGEFKPARSTTEIADIARWCCRGGWPSIIGLQDVLALETAPVYIESLLDTSIARLGKSPTLALSLMRALAANLTKAATHRVLAQDMTSGGEAGMPDGDTIASYLEVLSRLYLIENLGGWMPPLIAKHRLRTKPKRYYVDPSLPAALLGATPDALLRDTQTLGKLFETLCLRDLRVYLSGMPGLGNSVYYYRDDKDLEVDTVIQLGDGRWGAFEIKLSDSKVAEGAASLCRLAGKIAANPAAQTPEPAFLAVLVGKGGIAYRRDDGILVIPIATLGA